MSSHLSTVLGDRTALYPQRAIRREAALDVWARSLVGRIRHGLPARWWTRSAAVREALDRAEATALMADDALRSALHGAALSALHDGAQLGVALALVREAATRTLGLQPYAEQLLGAAVLLRGRLAEMQTGEGKTLTAGLAATIAACARLPVHVVTVNDYLAERDAVKLAPLYRFFGLSVGSVLTPMDLEQRRTAYACDVCYCTGKELVFDYLKDGVSAQGGRSQAQLELDAWIDGPQRGGSCHATLLRGLHFAIVDEADSIFIDEARTPLILSLNAGASDNLAMYQAALKLARGLETPSHFRIRPATRELELTDAGRSLLAERCLGMGPDWSVRVAREHQVAQALRALHMFHRDQHYVIKDDKVMIVDEQTGRVLPGRTWEHGLHQMIEVKEERPMSDRARTVARITYQRFFSRFLVLSGMTGTAREVRHELWDVYGLQTVVVPTHRPCLRLVAAVHCVASEESKWTRVCDRVAELHAQGRPVLVGTRSVAASQRLSEVLRSRAISHRVLNALQDAEEAALVETAGRAGTVTVATNMAGRGTDIELGPGVAERGGLHVILTEFHDSRRVDRQLFGRAARQGDPGSAQAIVSLDDALIADHAPGLRMMWHRMPGELGSRTWLALLRRHCQRRAEQQNSRQRVAATRSDREIEDMLSFSGRH